ncbi:ABC transporter permease [Pseudomaricurvus alcaniphilus]|uniref:FtsX-like permease family protein n=1 Tax=Pseudomaricurvus alcaniphilus TaxID=1166482 RepID=UPI00140C625D|nr:ABC transporter permease [Pseudomaricurvus alcaniphilus]
MSALLRANIGFLLRHPWQLALSLLGVGIGVAVIVAIDLANASAKQSFLLSMDAISGAATHQLIGGPAGIDEQFYVTLRVEHGLQGIAPVVEGSVSVGEHELQVLGIDPLAERQLRDFTHQVDAVATSGANRNLFRDLLSVPGAVLMSASTANLLQLQPGDHFELLAGGRRFPAHLLGTFKADSAAGLDNLISTDIATAQEWLQRPGRLSRIDVRLDPDDPATLQQLQQWLPADTRLLSAAGRTRSTAEMSAAFMINLHAMSLLALLVGVFLIYNAVSFSVLQRRPLIGVLRALGVTRGQILALILAEATIIGLLATVCGLFAGAWLGEQLLQLVTRSINDFYYRVAVTEVAIQVSTLAKGAAAGFGATLLAALLPALEAASYPPRLTLARSTLEQQARRLVPLLAAGGVGAMLAAGAVVLLSQRSLGAGIAAVLLLVLGFALCIPLLVQRSSALLAPLAARLGGVWARLALAGIGANLSRTGVATVALAVAVSASVGVSVMVHSFRGSVDRWLLQTLQADIYLGVRGGGLAPQLIEEIAGLDAVEAISSSRRVRLETERGQLQIQVLDMAPGSYAGTVLLDADPAAVWADFEQQDMLLVSEPFAWRQQLAAGDRLRLPTAAGEMAFRVAATYQSYRVDAGTVLMSRATYSRHFDDPLIDSIGLYLRANSDPQLITEKLQAISGGRQQLLINSNQAIRTQSLQVFDRTFIITDILYWLALGVAVIGIFSALLALQLERAREFGVLRALGMTPAQLGRMISLQSASIGLLAGLAALPLGLVMAYVLIEVINRRAFGWHIQFSLAPQLLLSALALALLAALLAGLYPAWRAARSQPATAMREE